MQRDILGSQKAVSGAMGRSFFELNAWASMLNARVGWTEINPEDLGRG